MGSEIIEVVERRRRWPVEVRLRILDEALQPGASVSAVAGRHGLARSLLYQWLRQVRERRMPGLSLKPSAAAAFASVSIVPEARDCTRGKNPSTSAQPLAATSTRAPAETSKRRNSAVEIRLANGRIVKVEESIEPDVLARLLAVVDGDRS
jgi:transposase